MQIKWTSFIDINKNEGELIINACITIKRVRKAQNKPYIFLIIEEGNYVDTFNDKKEIEEWLNNYNQDNHSTEITDHLWQL